MKKIFGVEFWVFTAIYLVLFGWAADAFDIVSRGAWVKYPAIGLMCAAGGLTVSFAGWLARRAGAYWLTFPAAFTLVEWFRTDIVFNYPFGYIGAVWIFLPLIFLQTAALVGAYGLGFLTVFLPLAVATKHFRTAAAAVFCVVGFGAWRLSLLEHFTDYNIRIVSAESGRDVAADDGIRAHAVGSMLPGWENVDLFVWPESVVNSGSREALPGREISVVNNERSALAFGLIRHTADASYNSLAVFRGHELELAYDKRNLAIYGEYIPWWFPVDMLNRSRSFTPGAARPGAVKLNGWQAFPLICHESIIPGLRVPGDIDFILNISSDYWAPPAGQRIHYGLVRMAAVAEGVPVVRATGHGISAVISPFGREAKRMDGGGILDGVLPGRGGRTLFSFTGNWLMLALCLGILIFARRCRKSGEL